jgi:carbamoyl-phosphate synthase large subunit
MLNILISCAGRQTGLVRAFQAALAGNGRVVATDHDPDAPALAAADHSELAPAIDDPGYLDWVLDQCARFEIGLLLSFVEVDTLRLETIRAELAALGCVLIGTPSDVIELAEDKLRTGALATAANLAYPDTWTLRDIAGAEALPETPWIVKARRGRGSRGLRTHATTAALRADAANETHGDAWIAQPAISGTHFSIDVVNDLDGTFQTVFIREKHEMRNGEAARTTTIDAARFAELGAALAAVTRHQGCIDIDIIEGEDGITLLDVNLRFGGAYIFSHAAGANLPAALVAWRNRTPLDPAWLRPRPGVTTDRADLGTVFST